MSPAGLLRPRRGSQKFGPERMFRPKSRQSQIVSRMDQRSGDLAILVAAFLHLFDDLGAEGFEIVWIAAGDQALIHDDRLVDPFGAGIFHIRRHGVIGRHRPALGDAGFHQHPRRMADGRDRLFAVEKVAHERDRVLVGTQQIGVDLPAGDDQRVILVDADRIDGAIDIDRGAPVAVLPATDLADLQGYDVHLGAGLFERLLRHHQLRLLESGCRKNHDPLVADVSHRDLLAWGEGFGRERTKPSIGSEAGIRGNQNGLVGPSEAANRTSPESRTTMAPPIAQMVHTALAQLLLPPPSLRASSREPSASVARTATVRAVPNAMAKVAATPAQNRPWVRAKTSTRMAPEHGLMPTETTTARTFRHDNGPAISLASTM